MTTTPVRRTQAERSAATQARLLEATIEWFADEQNRMAAPMYVDAPAMATAAE